MKSVNKKGQLGGLPIAVMTLVVTVIILVLGLVIIQEMRDTTILRPGTAGCNSTDVDSCDTAFVSTNASLSGLGDLGDFVPIIVIALAAGIVVAIVLGSFALRSRAR